MNQIIEIRNMFVLFILMCEKNKNQCQAHNIGKELEKNELDFP